jgi:general secretion pathway protein B
MSFILDALKKAESERSRQIGPVLMDVRIAAPRQRLPTWAWVLGCVLLANLLGLAWLMLRPQAAAPVELANGAGSANPTPPAAAAPPAAPPAAEPAAAAPPAPLAAAASTTITTPVTMAPAEPAGSDEVPTMQELLARGVTLPALVLNMHVYDPAPDSRFVLVNGRRLREGDELPDGMRVERITPSGVVLNARGRRFLLVAGG